MATAQQVFDAAIALMDEQASGTGKPDTHYTREYKNRTLPILNVILGELYPLSDTYVNAVPGRRPVTTPITDFESQIDLDEYMALAVMPCGLAAQLFMTEDTASASFLQQRYEELVKAVPIPTRIEPIENIYGGREFGGFARW